MGYNYFLFGYLISQCWWLMRDVICFNNSLSLSYFHPFNVDWWVLMEINGIKAQPSHLSHALGVTTIGLVVGMGRCMINKVKCNYNFVWHLVRTLYFIPL